VKKIVRRDGNDGRCDGRYQKRAAGSASRVGQNIRMAMLGWIRARNA